MKTRVLLVEDNPLTAKGLQYLLEREQYFITHAATAQTAEAELLAQDFDLILLDVSLPDGDGFQLAQTLRGSGKTLPIIFLTARDDENDVVHGLELGADDYITKPFRNRELLLRIKNALRREHKSSAKLVVGRISYNPDTLEVLVDEHEVALSAVERKLLVCLLEAAGHIVPRERLLDEIYDASGSIVNDNTLSVYLKRLREKLGLPGAIETVKNLGYRLRIPEATESKNS